jgi:DNA polymerase-1
LITNLTQDVNLMSVYTETAEWNGMTFYTGDIHHKTSTMLDIPRKLAKNLNFGLCYGMFPLKFARYARLFNIDEHGNKIYDVEQARGYRDRFFMLYPGILEMMEDLEKLRHPGDRGFVRTRFETICGRYRHFPKEEHVTGGKILNSIIQGSASDILNVIVWAIDEFILKNPRYKDVKMILQVHDEVCLEAPEELAQEVGVLVKYIMECNWFPMSVPVLASAKICDKWSDNGNDDVPEVGVMPPEESGIRAAVAMLTPEDREWAAQFVKVKDFTPVYEEAEFVEV